MSRVALLDLNVLVALFDPDHAHHEPAHDWFGRNRAAGWATCPLTENGLVRVLSNLAYSVVPRTPEQVVRLLRVLCDSGTHAFWEDSASLRDPSLFRPASFAGHRQLTDIYLLGLARRNGGCLATFDRTIPLSSVVDSAPEDLLVIPA